MIKESDFRWNETTVAPLNDGEVLLRNLAFSFDPTQREWMTMDTYVPAIPLGAVPSGAASSVPKRVVLRITPYKIASWDHTKLGGKY